MKGEDINKKFIDILLEDEASYIDDYKETMEKVKRSDATFAGEPVPTMYSPYYVTDWDLDNFKYITGTMMSIIDKITKEYLENKKFRERFMYPDFVEELIEIDPGYDMNAPIGRFDFFYKDRENFTFIELNTDGASCMNEDNTIAKILLETEVSKELSKEYKLDYFELFDSWVEKSLEIYSRFDSENKKPNVAIMDFEESATMTDFLKFKKAYERRGLNCKIVDPRDVEYRDNKMYFEDYRIDLVYRRIVTFELINNIDEISDFIEAYKNKAFCSIGSIRSQIGHNKIFFKILHDEDIGDILTEEEVDFIKKHIPFTGLFREDIKIYEEVLENKNKYIMKPVDMNASQGVFVGRDLSEEEWEEKLNEVWDKDYIYQEFIDPYGRQFPVLENDEFKIKDYGVVTGVFLYGEEISGVYNRVGMENIISNVVDYYSMPSIKVE